MSKKTQRKHNFHGPIDVEHCVAENITFVASLKSKFIKVFIGIIKALNAANSCEATELQLSDTGLKFVVEESKSFQTAAYIKKEFFESFYLKMPDRDVPMIGFGVNLKSFSELLTAILDNDLSSMNIIFYNDSDCLSFICKQQDSGEPLTGKGKQNLFQGDDETANDTSEEDEPVDITTEYFVRTLQSMDPIDFTAYSPSLVSFLILDAYEFHGIINDFDRSIDDVEIKVTDRRMTLKSIGILQYGAVVKLNQDSELFCKFECTEATKFAYKFSYFKTMLKSLLMASKVSLRTYADGMLRMQLMVRNEDDEETAAFVEYNIVPNLPEDEAQ